MTVQIALADTSVLIGWEKGRIASSLMPKNMSVSVITIGELKLGLLAARDPHERAARLRTLTQAMALEPLPVDETIADAWAELRITLREISRKLAHNDSWIAATAIAHGLPLAAQDRDYDDIPGLDVIKL